MITRSLALARTPRNAYLLACASVIPMTALVWNAIEYRWVDRAVRWLGDRDS